MSDKIKTYPVIKLHRGGTSIISFDFSEFDFLGGYVIFTIKKKTNYNSIFEYVFDKKEEINVVLDKQFTEGLNYSTYLYDLVLVVDGQFYPLCLPTEIIVEEVVANV